MLVTKREAKQASKKLLSVLLAVVMLMSSMSVCFGTISFAAGGNATDAQWNTLINALKNDTVKGASFSGSANDYTVRDPDGKILEAIEAYYAVFNAMSNKNPTNRTNFGGTNDISKTGESSDTAKRTINQLNTTINNELSSRMGAAYNDYNVKNFIDGLLCGANIDAGTSNKKVTDQNASVPATGLAAAPDIKLTVKLDSAILSYTLEELKALTDGVAAEKIFTVTHANTNYDYYYNYTAATEGGCGSSAQPAKYEHTFYFYYNVNADVVAKDGTTKTSVTPITNAAATLEANAAYFSYNLDQWVTLGLDNTKVITDIRDTIVAAKKSVVDGFSADVYNHFFSDYNVEDLTALVDKAVTIITAAHVALELDALVDAGYADIITNKGALESLAQSVKTLADKYDAYAADVKGYVESHEYEGEMFVRADVTDFYNAILKEIELIELRVIRDDILNKLPTYNAYNEENVTDGTVDDTTGEIINSTVTGADLDIAIGTMQGWINAIGTYDSANVAIVWEGADIVGILSNRISELNVLKALAKHNEDFAKEYAKYVTEVYKNTNLGAESEELFAAIQGYDSWYTGIKNAVAAIEEAYNVEIAYAVIEGHDAIMKAHLDSKYKALHDRVLAQVELAEVLFEKINGQSISIINLNTYKDFEKALGHVEVDTYNFLNGSANFEMPAETKAKYDKIWSLALGDYHNFVTSGGFDRYQQTKIEDIVRSEEDTDNHDAHIGDYKVTDENVEKIVDVIEKLLADEDIKAILGNLINKDKETGEPTGEAFDIASLITGLIEEKVFSDSLINTIIQFIYPAVANIFTEVWMGIDPWIDDPAMAVMGQTVSVKADLYLLTVEEATAGLGLPIFPDDLAAAINKNYSQFSAVADVLDDATTKAFVAKAEDGSWDESTRVSPWNDEALYTDKVDADGEVIVDAEGKTTKVLNLNWGIDALEGAAKKERFLQAVQAALCGIEPILLALLCNTPMERFNAKIGSGYGEDGLNGFNVGDVLFWKNVTLSAIELDIHTIDLRLNATANDGYNNVLAPLFELLGVTAPDGQDFKSTRDVIEKGLLKPLDAVIAKLAANPVSTLLEILPNLAYAIEMNMLLPKLNYLATNISYSAGATINADLNDCTCTVGLIGTLLPYLDDIVTDMTGLTCTNGVIQNVRADDVMTDNLPVEIASIIKIDELLGDVDLSSFAGIWEMIKGMLVEGVNLPAPVAGILATLGELTWKKTVRTQWGYTPLEAGKAAYIEANKADVLIYLLRYVFSVVQDKEAFRGLLGAFVTKNIQDTNEDGSLKFDDKNEPVMIKVPDTDKINKLVDETLTNFGLFNMNADEVIAALTELFNGVEYKTLKDYVWYVSELNEDTVVGMTPAIEQYLAYDNNWTKETATHIIENVDAIIGAVAGEEFDLSATLAGLIDGLFTNKNITALAKALSGIDLSAIDTGDLALDINALVNKFAGIDLTAFAAYADLADDYNWGFEDGNKAGFVKALVNLLAPLNPVLDFILAGENLALIDGDVEIIGYSGYDSAIVPLLEALGATPAALTDGDNALEAVLNVLIARIDAIVDDPINEILNLIPSLLYFVKSNGLTTAVRNLLQPVIVILETIDPIYALNLNQLIGGFTKDLGFSINLDNLSFEAIFDILGAVVDLDLAELEEIIDDVCEVITPVDYTSASSLIGANGKNGAYGEFFDAADLVTVLVSFALSWIQEGNNANDIVALIAGDDAAKAAEIQKYITGAITIIAGIEPEYQQIDWAYNFPANYEDAIFESGLTIQPTINTITYPTNWTEETAKYVGDNLDTIADEIVGLIDENYASVAELVKANVNIYSAENIDAIVAKVVELLEGIDAVLVETVGLVLGADIDALKAYKAPADIGTGAEFAEALADVLGTIQPVLDWLLFGEDYAFFSKNGANLVTIKGAEGYAYGLAPILEALGVEAPAKDEATVENVLAATFDRVDAILADPVNEVLDLLPNIVYFLNANGISVSVQNLLAGVTGLMSAVKEKFGVEVDLIAIINDLVNGMLEGKGVTLDVATLDLESIFALVQTLLAIDLTPIANILVDLCVGNITAYTSASGEYGFKMQYSDDFARYDMITIIVSCLLQIIKIEANAETIKGLLGEKAYEAVLNILSLDANVPIQDFNWIYTSEETGGNRVGEIFSALATSLKFNDDVYGDIYTEEHAEFIADNFGDFVNNIIYLLGLDLDGNGTVETDLTGVINGLVNGSIYNSDIIISIRDALAGLVETLETSIPAGAHILEVLKEAGIADLKAVAGVEVAEFTENRALFVESLCAVLEPIYPVLEWLFAGDDITFFVDEANNTLITLPGAEGYAFGLIPVLEVLECENILAPADYYAAVEADGSVLLTSILNPLLDRIDEIIAAPAEEILAILPNIIYFINSNGVDTVVKNTLNAVYTLLNAIEPIAKIDLYELIGIDLATIDFNWLLDKLLEVLSNAGYTFTIDDINAVSELTVGELKEYTSVNGKTAYKMVYAPDGGIEGGKTEMVTVIERLVITFLADEKNQETLMQLLQNELGMTDESAKYVRGLIKLIAECITDTSLGMQLALVSVYYVFYGVDTGAGEATGGYDELNDAWKQALEDLKAESPAASDIIEEILGLDIFEDIIDTDKGIAPNGFIKFFQKLSTWFQAIVNFFKNLFN